MEIILARVDERLNYRLNGDYHAPCIDYGFQSGQIVMKVEESLYLTDRQCHF